MIPGFLHRFNAELIHLASLPAYINRLVIKQFRFHSPPAHLNYAAWLGGKKSFFFRKTVRFINCI